MAEAYLSDEMANSEEEKLILHRQAMDYYRRWQADQRRRWLAYDARVDAYHAALRRVSAEIEIHGSDAERACRIAAE